MVQKSFIDVIEVGLNALRVLFIVVFRFRLRLRGGALRWLALSTVHSWDDLKCLTSTKGMLRLIQSLLWYNVW